MDDYDFSDLDEHQDSLNRDLESLKGHLDSFVSDYKNVSNRCQITDQNYADLEKCVKDYQYALKLLLMDYGDLLTLSSDPKESEDGIKNRIQDKLKKMKKLMDDKSINLQYQIPGEKYVDTDDILSLDYADTTNKDLNGVVKKITCIGLSSGNIKGDRAIPESTTIYRYRDSSDSSISDTSAKEGASEAAVPAPLGSTEETVGIATHGTLVYSEVSLPEEGISEETSYEADSTNQTDENRHALADVDAPLCLINMDRNSDGKYELSLSDKMIEVGISDPPFRIAVIREVPSDWDTATDIKITLTEDDTSLSLNATEGIFIIGDTHELSYGTCFLKILMKEDTQNTGHRGTVTYKKTKKPIEYYAHVTNIEKAKDVKLEREINWESPKPFTDVDKKYYYRPMGEHWKTESTDKVLKYIADYSMEENVDDQCDNKVEILHIKAS